MLAWTWRTWPDVIVDFGRELYVPWRLAAGQVLYRDIAYFNGPVSPYWNALWFRLFGVSFATLIAANVLCIAAVAALLYRLLCEVGSRASATAAGVLFMTVFAFGTLLSNGNYNYVAPYSHDLPHGILLSLLAIFFLSRYQRRRSPGWLAASGLAVGTLALTKLETLLAGGLAVVVGLALTFWAERPDPARLRRAAGTFVGAAAVPPLVALVLFSAVIPVRQALREPLGHWLAPTRAEVAALPFYREIMGTADIRASVKALAISSLAYAAVLGPGALLAIALRGQGRRRRAVAVSLFAAVVVALGVASPRIAWQEAARPLPLLMLGLGLASLAGVVRRIRAGQADHRLVLQVTLLVFAGALLLKMALNARVHHYGFALAMPAALLLVVALLDWIPAALDRSGAYGAAFRAGASGALLVALAAHLAVTYGEVRLRGSAVFSGGDTVMADARGLFVSRALDELKFRARRDQTLVVLPEGVMLNYLSRLPNPTPYITFIPVEVALFGEDHMLRSLEAHPADFVILVHRETSEYGVQYFGQDYAKKINAWVMANYRPITVIGAWPFRDGRFGMLLMRRKDQPPAGTR
jgi:4-amino-4-deoxy-L-arabinose transferase-like glycosyltransferase